jgi:membrane associated rhomboid family serine protease
MKSNTGYDSATVNFTCPSGEENRGTNNTCTLEPVCQLPGSTFSIANPNQWYRFLTAIFLHGGVVHLLLNLSFQVNVGFQMEREMGWWRIALIYMISGAGGFIFGAPLSDIRIPTVGSSGALYGATNN